MSTYTLQQLRDEGPQYAMAMLIECIKFGEPFVTYGAIGAELEYQLEIQKIFPTQIGHVAGTLMDDILEIEPNAPLINVLITRPTGIPGKGVGGFLANRYEIDSLHNWDAVSRDQQIEIVARERKKIFSYREWEELYSKLFGNFDSTILKEKSGTEYDAPKFSSHGGPAESREHKKLKSWVAKHPQKIGIRKSFGHGITESRLLSGDEVDVLFSDGDSFRTVEVKSIRSNDEDLKRGLYQCVKYRELKKAEHIPYDVDVQSILVTERNLTPELQERAKLLSVKWICVSVNKTTKA